MLADVGGRTDDFGLADVVVFDEDDFEQVADVRVVVDHCAHAVDQVNDRLGHPVSWSSLAAEDGDTRGQLGAFLGAHGLDAEVAVDDTQDVKLLTLVLMETLDLDIEQGLGVDFDARGFEDVFGQTLLVGGLDGSPLGLELLVVDEAFQLVEQGEVLEELVAAELGGDEV